MQDKFKINEVFNNGAYKICESSYKSVRAGRIATRDIHDQSDFVWTCVHKRCTKKNQRAYPVYSPYIAWVDKCDECGEYVFVIKTNKKVPNP